MKGKILTLKTDRNSFLLFSSCRLAAKLSIGMGGGLEMRRRFDTEMDRYDGLKVFYYAAIV